MILRTFRWAGLGLSLAIATTCTQAGTVLWDFGFTDTGASYFTDSTLGVQRQDALRAAGALLSASIRTPGTEKVTLHVEVASTSASYLAATSATYFPTPSNSFVRSFAERTVQSNAELTIAPAINMFWSTSYAWGWSNVAAGQYDAVAVAMHELLHGLGIDGNVDPSNLKTAWYSTFDRFVSGYDSVSHSYVPLVSTDASGNSAGLASGAGLMLKNSLTPLIFTGANATAANGGTPVSLYTPALYASGNSVYHVGSPDDLMYFASGTGLKSHTLSAVDLGILEDLGYSVEGDGARTETVAVEPTTLVMFVSLTPIGAMFWMRKRRGV